VQRLLSHRCADTLGGTKVVGWAAFGGLEGNFLPSNVVIIHSTPLYSSLLHSIFEEIFLHF